MNKFTDRMTEIFVFSFSVKFRRHIDQSKHTRIVTITTASHSKHWSSGWITSFVSIKSAKYLHNFLNILKHKLNWSTARIWNFWMLLNFWFFLLIFLYLTLVQKVPMHLVQFLLKWVLTLLVGSYTQNICLIKSALLEISLNDIVKYDSRPK